MLLTGISKRLADAKGKWPEELPSVIWSYNTRIHTSTGETPFKLAYGSDAMLPVEIKNFSWRATTTNEKKNEENLMVNVDLLLEIEEQAKIKNEASKQLAAKRYDTCVVPR